MRVIIIILTLWISTLILIARIKIKTFKKRETKFLQTTILLTLILVLAFSVNNLFRYYIFFEASLIPTLVIILTWGYQPERLEAGIYLILYTIGASLPLLIGILYLYTQHNTVIFFVPQQRHPLQTNIYLELRLLLAFLVKLPIYLTHLWLPKAHVEAPVAGSIILARVLLKLGAYGLLRIGTIYPSILRNWSPIIISISLWGATITSFLCIRQTDIKSIIAYSSVRHIALLAAGIFSFSSWGWRGALVIIIAHGLSRSGLFALANIYYEHTESRRLLINKGILFICPPIAIWWILIIAANIAAPPTINILAEVLLIISIISYNHLTAILLITTCFFTACYSLILYTSLHHGAPHHFTTPVLILPLYHTIRLLHIAPLIILITSATQLAYWL